MELKSVLAVLNVDCLSNIHIRIFQYVILKFGLRSISKSIYEDAGYFWIKRSADKGYQPAIKALTIISQDDKKMSKQKLKYPSPSSTSENALYY